MQAIDRRFETIHRRQVASHTDATSQNFRSAHFLTKSLISVLFSALVFTMGPAALETVAGLSAQLIHILLQLCKVSLLILEIFAR